MVDQISQFENSDAEVEKFKLKFVDGNNKYNEIDLDLNNKGNYVDISLDDNNDDKAYIQRNENVKQILFLERRIRIITHYTFQKFFQG